MGMALSSDYDYMYPSFMSNDFQSEGKNSLYLTNQIERLYFIVMCNALKSVKFEEIEAEGSPSVGMNPKYGILYLIFKVEIGDGAMMIMAMEKCLSGVLFTENIRITTVLTSSWALP